MEAIVSACDFFFHFCALAFPLRSGVWLEGRFLLPRANYRKSFPFLSFFASPAFFLFAGNEKYFSFFSTSFGKLGKWSRTTRFSESPHKKRNSDNKSPVKWYNYPGLPPSDQRRDQCFISTTEKKKRKKTSASCNHFFRLRLWVVHFSSGRIIVASKRFRRGARKILLYSEGACQRRPSNISSPNLAFSHRERGAEACIDSR